MIKSLTVNLNNYDTPSPLDGVVLHSRVIEQTQLAQAIQQRFTEASPEEKERLLAIALLGRKQPLRRRQLSDLPGS